jgi:seryl-tRNA synthetase
MRYPLPALLVVLVSFSAVAAEDDTYRLMKVEQDVRNLERQVQTLTRELDDLRQQQSRAGSQLPSARSSSAPAGASSTAWLEATRWERIRTGMSELEVIGVLGPPTSMRQDGDTRVLLYAMEIGSTGFLGGSVEFRDRAVTAVNKPVLK